MISVNRVILQGRVGTDPKLNTTKEGKQVANFSVATNDRIKNVDGQKVSTPEWHSVTIFNTNLIEKVLPYIKKGSEIYIEGKLKTSKYVDSKGIDRYKTEIILDNYGSTLTLGFAPKTQDENDNINKKDPSEYDIEEGDDDLNF